MNPSLPFGVMFDMDGVLLDSEPFICKAAMMMFTERGLIVQPEDFLPFVGAGEDRFIGGVAEKYAFPLKLQPGKKRTYEIYLEIIRGKLHPLKGALAFLESCRKSGKKMVLATSADYVKMAGNLKEIGVSPSSFDAVITGEDVIRKKPDPEIFILAAKRLNLKPDECLVVEDAVNGVRAAKASGGRCLALTTSFIREELFAAGADWCAKNLSQAPKEALEWYTDLSS
ncbi:MAG: HAD-IA family hydrolase [Candidatus Omnitrophota bacterium]